MASARSEDGRLVFSGIRVGERERRGGKGDEGENLGWIGTVCTGAASEWLDEEWLPRERRIEGDKCMYSAIASFETTHHSLARSARPRNPALLEGTMCVRA